MVPPGVSGLQALDAGLAGMVEELRRECGQPEGAQPRLSVEYNGRQRRLGPIGLQRILAENAELISACSHPGFVFEDTTVVVEYEFPPPPPPVEVSMAHHLFDGL